MAMRRTTRPIPVTPSNNHIVRPIVISILIGNEHSSSDLPLLLERCKARYQEQHADSPIDFDSLVLTDRVKRSRFPKGRGHYADVYQGTLDDNTVVAVKIFRLPTRQLRQEQFCEAFLPCSQELSGARNIVPFLGLAFEEGYLGIVSPWYPHGNLVDYLQSNPNANKLHLAIDIAEGVRCLHTNPHQVVHGDLKGRNIYIDAKGVAYLADIGVLDQINKLGDAAGYTVTSGNAGVLPWMAPELLSGAAISQPSDVYAYAGILLEIWCPGKYPYYYMRQTETVFAKYRGALPDRQRYPELASQDYLWKLMSACWSNDPVTRPSIEDIIGMLQHGFGQSSGDNTESSQQAEEEESNQSGYRSLPTSSILPVSQIRLSLSDYDADQVEFSEDSPITSGGYCELFLGVHLPSKVKLALKRPRISFPTEETLRRFRREAEIWSTFRHPNILPFFGFMDIHKKMYLISPWMSLGDLFAFVQRRRDYINQGELKGPTRDSSLTPLYFTFNEMQIVREVAAGIEYLHSLDIIHGDMKARNVLLSDDGQAQICDFGLTKSLDHDTTSEFKGAGTLRWQSPELLYNKPKNLKSDIYAFAMTIVEILTADYPFAHLKEQSAVLVAIIVEHERPAPVPASCLDVDFQPLWRLAARCWATDAESRPSMAEVSGLLSQGT